jgi:multidrug efflux pump subunit AcrB
MASATRTVFGLEQYAMRIWLDPNKMTQLGITGDDVMNAVRAQSLQASLGAIGAEPSIDAPPQCLRFKHSAMFDQSRRLRFDRCARR